MAAAAGFAAALAAQPSPSPNDSRASHIVEQIAIVSTYRLQNENNEQRLRQFLDHLLLHQQGIEDDILRNKFGIPLPELKTMEINPPKQINELRSLSHQLVSLVDPDGIHHSSTADLAKVQGHLGALIQEYSDAFRLFQGCFRDIRSIYVSHLGVTAKSIDNLTLEAANYRNETAKRLSSKVAQERRSLRAKRKAWWDDYERMQMEAKEWLETLVNYQDAAIRLLERVELHNVVDEHFLKLREQKTYAMRLLQDLNQRAKRPSDEQLEDAECPGPFVSRILTAGRDWITQCEPWSVQIEQSRQHAVRESASIAQKKQTQEISHHAMDIRMQHLLKESSEQESALQTFRQTGVPASNPRHQAALKKNTEIRRAIQVHQPLVESETKQLERTRQVYIQTQEMLTFASKVQPVLPSLQKIVEFERILLAQWQELGGAFKQRISEAESLCQQQIRGEVESTVKKLRDRLTRDYLYVIQTRNRTTTQFFKEWTQPVQNIKVSETHLGTFRQSMNKLHYLASEFDRIYQIINTSQSWLHQVIPKQLYHLDLTYQQQLTVLCQNLLDQVPLQRFHSLVASPMGSARSVMQPELINGIHGESTNRWS